MGRGKGGAQEAATGRGVEASNSGVGGRFYYKLLAASQKIKTVPPPILT